jgi:hypothetical protein
MASSHPTERERKCYGIDPRRRREENCIRRMQESNRPVFDEICRRFIRGGTAAGVATWLWHLKPLGFLGTISYETLRTDYLAPLRRHLRDRLQQRAEQIREAGTDPPPPQVPPRPDDPETVLQFAKEVVSQVNRPRMAHVTDELRLMADQRIAEVQGLEMLKYLFFQQDIRFRAALQLERCGNGMLNDEVTHLADVMRRIAECICKVEFRSTAP